MARTLLALSQISNIALAEAMKQDCPVNCCEVRENYDLSIDTMYYDFEFGASGWMNKRHFMRTPQIYARSYDEDWKTDGLTFMFTLTEDLPALHTDDIRALISEQIAAIVFGLKALRMAG